MELKIEIERVRNVGELNALVSIFEDVFEMVNFNGPNPAHLESLLKKDTFFAIMAKINGEIIGGLTVYLLDQYYSEKPLAYIYDLAVSTKFQRQGIGRKLIAYTHNYCVQKGFEGAFVQAEKADDHAIDFYRLTHPTEEMQVVHFYYNFKNGQ